MRLFAIYYAGLQKRHDYLEIAVELKKQRGCEKLGKIMLAPYKVWALDSACSDYRAHLEDEFYEYLLKSYPEKSVELNEKRNHKPDIYARDTMLYRSDDIVRLQGNEGFKLLVSKYKCLNEMQDELKVDESPLVILANFRGKFDQHRHVLNESRSTGVVNFFKAVATVLTAGLALCLVFGVWKAERKVRSLMSSQKMLTLVINSKIFANWMMDRPCLDVYFNKNNHIQSYLSAAAAAVLNTAIILEAYNVLNTPFRQ